MHEFSHTYKFIRMRGPELKGYAEMAVWKLAVVQPRSSTPVQTQSRDSKRTPTLHHLSAGTDEVEGVAQQMDTKEFQCEQAPTDVPSVLHLPASVPSKGASHVEIQSSSTSESQPSEATSSDRVDSGFSASNGSSEENNEQKESTDSATKSEPPKKGNPSLILY